MGSPKWLQRTIEIYTEVIENLVFILFAALVLVSVFVLLTRNVPGLPIITWGEEVMLFLLVAIIFLISGLALRRGLHLGFDLLVEKLPGVSRKLLWTINYLLVIWLLGTLTWASKAVVQNNLTQLSPALQIPMAYPYLAIPIGSLMMIGECVAKLIQLWWPAADSQSPSPGRATTGG